ncbi:MAG: hypothetical protein QM679_03075 [Patulibacter sp.]
MVPGVLSISTRGSVQSPQSQRSPVAFGQANADIPATQLRKMSLGAATHIDRLNHAIRALLDARRGAAMIGAPPCIMTTPPPIAGRCPVKMPRSETLRPVSVARRFAAFAILGIAIVGTLLIWWPGHMGADFLSMYGDALAHRPTDFHSPMFELALEALHPLGAGPGWVLFAQVTGLALGAYLLFRAQLTVGWSAIATSVLLLSPMAFGMAGSLGRDVWFAERLLLAFGATIALHRHPRRRNWWTALAVLGLAVVIFSRQNGLFAAPFAITALVIARRGVGVDRLRNLIKPVLLGGLASAALLFGTLAVMYAGGVERRYPQTILQIYDISAIASYGGNATLPPSLRTVPMSRVAATVEAYPRDVAALIWAGDSSAVTLPGTAEQRKELATAWRQAIVHNPLRWLRVRARMWTQITAMTSPSSWIYHPVVDPNAFGFSPADVELNEAGNDYMAFFATGANAGTFLFDGWIYVALTIGCIPLLWRRRDVTGQVLALLGVGSLAYQVSMFLLNSGADYRFMFPSVLVAIVLTVTMVAMRPIALRPIGGRPVNAPAAPDSASER